MMEEGKKVQCVSSISRFEGGTRKASSAERQMPLLSIIMVAFRDREEVASLMDNIAPFRANDVEFVIVDGGSDDGTLELLQGRDEDVDYWVSEPDSGIYDAMNKGIAVARGEYVLHLNAGDRLLVVPRSELAACLRENVDVAVFQVQLDDGKVHIPSNNLLMLLTNTWHNQGTFYRRGAHLGYDTSFRVFGDFDHNQRIAKSKRSVRIFNRIISKHGNPGLSASMKHYGEVYRSVRRNSGIIFVPLAFLRDKFKGIQKRISLLKSEGCGRLRA